MIIIVKKTKKSSKKAAAKKAVKSSSKNQKKSSTKSSSKLSKSKMLAGKISISDLESIAKKRDAEIIKPKFKFNYTSADDEEKFRQEIAAIQAMLKTSSEEKKIEKKLDSSANPQMQAPSMESGKKKGFFSNIFERIFK